MKIIVTGCNGQLGTEIIKQLHEGRSEIGPIPDKLLNATVIAVDLPDLDISNYKMVDAVSYTHLAQAKAKKEYAKLFPGRTMRADRFASAELLVRQAADQPAAPRISIVVPLYNTPQQFLVELLDSVQNQTYQNWELCLVDAGQDETVGQTVAARAAEDPRIRYQKLEKNEGIAGNTNQGFALATGEFIALLDHDDILHPCALWYVAQAIAEQGADFVYTDEVTFEGDIDHLTVYHFKPDYMLDNLRSNNYICHLSVFSAKLLAAVGGDERAAYNGSQDYDLYLRLTEKAHKIVHIPHLLYYWRSSPTSVASNISAKTYCLEAAVKALYAHYELSLIHICVEIFAKALVAHQVLQGITDHKTSLQKQAPALPSAKRRRGALLQFYSFAMAASIMACASATMASVSYTHLDVYKRQGSYMANRKKKDEALAVVQAQTEGSGQPAVQSLSLIHI